MKKMYPAVVNSPKTELTDLITESQTDITVADTGVLLPGEGIATIGNGDAAETILYTSVDGNILKGCIRGFQGVARAWTAGTRIARNFAAADWDAARLNILEMADRLDTPNRTAISLLPGIQVVQADQDAAFKLAGLQGRTLVNLLGRDGNFEDASKWSLASCSFTLDNTSFLYGSSSGKATTTGTNSSGLVRRKTLVPIDNTKYYIAIVEIKNTDATSAYLRVMKPDYSATLKSSTPKTNKGSYLLHYVKLSPADLVGLNSISFDLVFPYVNTGSVINFDGGGVYEVDKALYDRIGVDVTESNIRDYLPYVDSVQPVRNPYAIRYGENLIPPFYEASLSGSGQLPTGPYAASLTATVVNVAWIFRIPCSPNTEYTFSLSHNGMIALQDLDAAGNIIQNSLYQDTPELHIKTSPNAAYLSIIIGNGSKGAGTYTFSNPMLTLGTTPKPFKPREDVMLALQTELYADPATGANADEVFEKDGQYFKLAKWNKLVLDGSVPWVHQSSKSGFKVVSAEVVKGGVNNSGTVTKYNGNMLPRGDAASAGDMQNVYTLGGAGSFYLSVLNTDSGWGDSYTPTTDEIKAYFMGWRMFTDGQDALTNTYAGTGTKKWVKFGYTSTSGVPSDAYSATLPITLGYVNGATPYQLVYQLATPTVEPITSEGQLTFIEGDNQVEVGTGIVLREATKPVMTKVGSIEYYHFNNTDSGVNNPFKYRVGKILNIYMNGKRAAGVVVKNEKEAYGNQDAHIEGKDFIKDGAYTATYLMLDKSPIAPFIGSVPDNEKALLMDLVQDVQQAKARISVVESKKAEKDAPAWIEPTLLSGWANFLSGFSPAGFYKDSMGYVHIRGLIKSGAGGAFFKLPKGYRPTHALAFSTISAANSAGDGALPASINIFPDGTVITAVNFQSGFMSLEGISFLAAD
ncbi:hypothetical protein [Paenibacillus xylanilyticus]|uniref:Tail fiber protein n=1 Tax=Paenibacillus xylanilyticus TaxID=248903 RepID=A0A7Y6ERR2_9BACL|nr:hypothetical protein [Paenibacillus xylanilyticus]NUU74182.1 hypothetical protein [Paenibacillus xylanilyticus]